MNTQYPPLPAWNPRGWTAAYWTCQVLGWGGYVAIGLMMAPHGDISEALLLGGYAAFFLYSIALTHGLRAWIRRHDWLSLAPQFAAPRLFFAAVVVGVIQTLLIVVVQSVWTWKSPFSFGVGNLAATGLSTTWATVVWTALYTGASALMRTRRVRHQAIALELDMREARLKALEAQIGPHFLFNCLNSLRGMIAENPAVAQDMVTRLANILRHNLARRDSPVEFLGEQVEFTTDYLALESVRFEERLRTRFDIAPETRTCAAPAMVLQTLVENAIKHGISHLPDGGEVMIRSRLTDGALEVVVENTGSLTAPPAGSTRVGLKNLTERLRVLYGARASFELAEGPAGTIRATVRIPLNPSAS